MIYVCTPCVRRTVDDVSGFPSFVDFFFRRCRNSNRHTVRGWGGEGNVMTKRRTRKSRTGRHQQMTTYGKPNENGKVAGSLKSLVKTRYDVPFGRRPLSKRDNCTRITNDLQDDNVSYPWRVRAGTVNSIVVECLSSSRSISRSVPSADGPRPSPRTESNHTVR